VARDSAGSASGCHLLVAVDVVGSVELGGGLGGPDTLVAAVDLLVGVDARQIGRGQLTQALGNVRSIARRSTSLTCSSRV
jgi:hypothetical protein